MIEKVFQAAAVLLAAKVPAAVLQDVVIFLVAVQLAVEQLLEAGALQAEWPLWQEAEAGD